MATPRIVIVHRRTELQELLDRHATRGQAEFFLRTRGRSIQDVQDRHDQLTSALATIRAAVPSDWRQAEVERADLSRFLLTAEDIIAVVGQDGLVANVAKYLNGQPVIGIDPEPGANPGVLVRHTPARAAALLGAADVGRLHCQNLTTVTATLDDGQQLSALNEVFVGHASHQSAKYTVTAPEFHPVPAGKPSGSRRRALSFPREPAPPAGAPPSPWNAAAVHCLPRAIRGSRGSSAKHGLHPSPAPP